MADQGRVLVRPPQRFVHDGQRTFAVLPRALGDELFDPESQRMQRRRQHDRQLVAAVARTRAEEGAELQSRILTVLLTAAFGHCRAPREEVADRRADERARQEAEQRQRREAAADVGRIQEDVPVSSFLRERLQRGRGIRDRDEMAAGRCAEALGHPRPEQPLHRGRFDRGPALAGDDEPRALWFEPIDCRRDRRLVGRVHHDQLGVTVAIS